MKLSIVGTGYVGLVSGACLAERGHEVICVDIDAAKVDAINACRSPIHEEGLTELLHANVPQRLRAVTDLRAAVLATDATLITVGTPDRDGKIDLAQLRAAAEQVGEALRRKEGWHLVVVKSTVVPGTTEEVVLPIVARASGRQAGEGFGVGMNPEFLREGCAVADFRNPDRIVLGAIDERSAKAMAEIYASFSGVTMVRTTPRTAEMIKYASNSLLATLISFSNELANLCQAVGGLDVADVLHGVHLDRRISPVLRDGQRVVPEVTSYLEAGCGFGGSCFPKDVKALIAYGEQHQSRMRILEEVIALNARQPLQLMSLLKAQVPDLRGRVVTVLGLAFKPGTDDVRESPALPVIDALLKEGARVRACDPVVKNAASAGLPAPIELFDQLDQAVSGADAILLVTRWPQFKALPALLRHMPNAPVVVDGRRFFPRADIARYTGIGLS